MLFQSASPPVATTMLSHFTPWHIPPLFVGTFTALGGLWPIFHTSSGMKAFGFTDAISDARISHPVMITAAARTSAFGALLFLFWSQNKIPEMDLVLAIYGAYVGTLDGYALVGVNNGKALFRMLSGLAIGAWGYFGLSSSVTADVMTHVSTAYNPDALVDLALRNLQ